jgi:hypothetical protein
MSTNLFDDDGLFGDIASDVPKATADRMPLGGVHRAVISALGTPVGMGGVSHTSENKRRLGVTTTRGDKGWKSSLEQPMTRAEVTAMELSDEVTIISREVDGSWRTGASDLSREAIVEFLGKRGYVSCDEEEEIIRSKSLEIICRIEKFTLKPR